MKLTSLTIAHTNSWQGPSAKNHLRAVVKLDSENSSVECVLSDETMRRMLDLCAQEIAANAERNVREFVAAVTAIEADKAAVLLGPDWLSRLGPVSPFEYTANPYEPGMSLRDWFAGQALAGYFAAPNTPHQNATDCAAYIYEMADAMLAARKGGGA